MSPTKPNVYETEHAPSSASLEAGFSGEELLCLAAMRARFAENHDLFTDRELARMRFMRWLIETGRLVV